MQVASISDLIKALEAGERWITIHPPGHEKGQPLLIKEHPDGTASVIGGAGNKLNHLKLRGKGHDASYRETVEAKYAEKAAAKRAAKKAQRQADRESGAIKGKQAAKKALQEEVETQTKEILHQIATLSGLDTKDIQFDEDAHQGLSDAAKKAAKDEHVRKIVETAKEAVSHSRQKLINDHEARVQANLGELPLENASPDALSVADLQPLPEVAARKLGFDPKYQERSGLSKEDIQAEVTGQTDEGKDVADMFNEPKEPAPPPKPQQTPAKASEAKQKIQEELDAFRLANPETRPTKKAAIILTDAQKAAQILLLDKKLRMLKQKAKEANAEIDKATAVESKAYVLSVSDAEVDAATQAEFENNLRTHSARSFLDAIEKGGGEAKMAGHVAAGAFNALNSAASVIGGKSLIDRSVVDVLGVAGAAQVLARRIKKDRISDAPAIQSAVEEYHLDHAAKVEREAVAKAQALHDAANAIQPDEATDGDGLTQAQAAVHKKREALKEAQKILGQAHGEMQANAALVSAIQGKHSGAIEVNLGAITPEKAIVQLHAIGLQKGDYRIDKVGDAVVAKVEESGLDKLAHPIDVEDLNRVSRNLAIMNGEQDEPNWLPKGVARRPDLAAPSPPGVAPRLSKPFNPGSNPQKGLQDYIGGRMADGDSMEDILADMQSLDFITKSGLSSEKYHEALRAVAPLMGKDGVMKPIQTLRDSWEKMADEYVNEQYGVTRSPLHSQRIPMDQTSVDALHRALAEVPEGVAAYKAISDLTPQERTGLRNWWYKNIGHEDPESATKRQALEKHLAKEPQQKEVEDMFGDITPNPDWQEWKSKRDELAADANSSELNWARYCDLLGGTSKAIQTTQDLIRSQVAQKFAHNYNSLKPDQPIKIGRRTIANNLAHSDAVDPAMRRVRLEQMRKFNDSFRERTSSGQYSSGGILDKVEQAKKAEEAMNQSQWSLFSGEELDSLQNDLFGDGQAPQKEMPLKTDERYSLGTAAENNIASMMGVVGQNFRPGQPTQIWSPNMSDGTNVARQRFLKFWEANKRVAGSLGTGSGKSLLALSGFTHLHAQGKVKRGLFLTPSGVQGQMGGEAIRYLEPGKYKWHAEPGASREERLAAYRDPNTHFVVATHQGFRDDMIHLAAKHAGISEAAMSEKVSSMKPDELRSWAKSIMDKEGFSFDLMGVDESQNTLDRKGKEDSKLSNVVKGFGAHASHYGAFSADPIKNDISEAHALLSSLEPDRHGDRDEFMRKFGGDTLAAKQGLHREMVRSVFASHIEPDVKVSRQIHKVALNDAQQSELKALDESAANARIARMNGKVDMAALQHLSPDSFANAPSEDHEKIAAELQKNIGMLRHAAIQRTIDAHPQGAKLDAAEKLANERKGKPGVVFAHRLETVQHLKERLEKAGHRVVTLTGADTGDNKTKKRQAFNPETGDANADILIASDAGATGLNLQRGQWLLNMDSPATAMTHAQRNGRIFRTGQKNNIELMDLVADHPAEQKARDRLKNKYGLREMMTSPLGGLDDTGLASYLQRNLKHDDQMSLF